LTNYKCTFSSSQVCKLQNYKLHVLICKFQIYKITSQFTKLKILKLQVHVCKYVKLPNYKVTKLQIASALLHTTSLHMLDFHVFILACTTKLQDYKHINFQFAAIASYKLQNYNLGYRPMTKFASLQNQNIYKLLITNYKFTI